MICHKSDRNLGARDWDYDICKVIGAEFEKKFGDNPMDNKRCIVRMLEGVEKARKMLSSVSDAQISIDYLLNEEDLTRVLKKDEFEAIIEPYIKRFSKLVNDTILLSGLTADQIHFVEMMGDATRTPIILETTQALFNKPETSRTLNSIDAIARGAALQSAFLSPAFNTGVFKVEEFNHLPIEVIYGDTGSQETKSAVMFPAKTSKCPNKKSITFNNKVGGMDIQLKYAEGAEILEGLPSIIAQYQVPEGKLKHADKDQASHELAFEIENSLH